MNHEPSCGQFRIHAVPGNSVVVARYGDALGLKDGTYTVKGGDLPLYTVALCGLGSRDIRMLPLAKRASSEMLVCSERIAARR